MKYIVMCPHYSKLKLKATVGYCIILVGMMEYYYVCLKHHYYVRIQYQPVTHAILLMCMCTAAPYSLLF